MDEDGVDARLAGPARDKLCRLGPEIEDGHDLVVRPVGLECALFSCGHRILALARPVLGKRGAYAAAGAASMAGLAGCPSVPEGFDSPDPTRRMAAIAEAGYQGRESAIPALLEQLESVDPGARLLAILSLERITGVEREVHGYDYAAPLWERAEAVEWWRRWAVDRGGVPESGGTVRGSKD